MDTFEFPNYPKKLYPKKLSQQFFLPVLVLCYLPQLGSFALWVSKADSFALKWFNEPFQMSFEFTREKRYFWVEPFVQVGTMVPKYL